MEQNKTLSIVRSQNIGHNHSDRPNIGDEHIMDGKPCYVIDVCNDGAWFGLVKGIRRVDRWKGAFREYGAIDYPKKA